jgi:hypothetical protein
MTANQTTPTEVTKHKPHAFSSNNQLLNTSQQTKTGKQTNKTTTVGHQRHEAREMAQPSTAEQAASLMAKPTRSQTGKQPKPQDTTNNVYV